MHTIKVMSMKTPLTRSRCSIAPLAEARTNCGRNAKKNSCQTWIAEIQDDPAVTITPTGICMTPIGWSGCRDTNVQSNISFFSSFQLNVTL